MSPTTYHELAEWLEDNLFSKENGEDRYTDPLTGKVWRQKCGYRYAFHILSVFTTDTHYAFHVEPDHVSPSEFSHFPNMGSYESYEHLKTAVIDRYAKSWKIEE